MSGNTPAMRPPAIAMPQGVSPQPRGQEALNRGVRLPKAAIEQPPRISRKLHTAAGWLEEMSKLYREARRRQLDSSEASRLTWICSQAAKLAEAVETLKQNDALRRALEDLNGEPLPALSPPTSNGDTPGDEADALLVAAVSGAAEERPAIDAEPATPGNGNGEAS
jgi:hypothetical protein